MGSRGDGLRLPRQLCPDGGSSLCCGRGPFAEHQGLPRVSRSLRGKTFRKEERTQQLQEQQAGTNWGAGAAKSSRWFPSSGFLRGLGEALWGAGRLRAGGGGQRCPPRRAASCRWASPRSAAASPAKDPAWGAGGSQRPRLRLPEEPQPAAGPGGAVADLAAQQGPGQAVCSVLEAAAAPCVLHPERVSRSSAPSGSQVRAGGLAGSTAVSSAGPTDSTVPRGGARGAGSAGAAAAGGCGGGRCRRVGAGGGFAELQLFPPSAGSCRRATWHQGRRRRDRDVVTGLTESRSPFH